ncbi:OmpA family protein [Thermocrinis minervae]|uniref:Peptidoglycan-associated lipoprotein n=1 Tax=Thermocrinis minervae TaxID=381751 RepID=A0A1M6TIT1_9AQUI|nr:OmpA family protein [Thermocrinis minervae]SHK56837.1 peptidoglycan-associated lipoprotein [Thermocrinis minervae]
MKKIALASALFVGLTLSLGNAQELTDPCGSPKEVFSKYLLDKCYKNYFDAITGASKKADEAISKVNDLEKRVGKLENIADDHEKRIRALEGRPVQETKSTTEQATARSFEATKVGTVHFAFNKFTLSKKAVDELKNVAQKLKDEKGEVLVVGFADKRGTSKYNFDLSMHRAQMVASELVKLGVDESRIRITAYGKELAQKFGKEFRAQRAVEIYLVK